MNIDVAREYANALLKAADIAQAEGRTELLKSDMDQFTSLDDAARAELQEEIDKAL